MIEDRQRFPQDRRDAVDVLVTGELTVERAEEVIGEMRILTRDGLVIGVKTEDVVDTLQRAVDLIRDGVADGIAGRERGADDERR